MPRKPKPKPNPRELTTDEAMERLFGKRGANHARKLVRSVEKPQVKQRKRPIKKKDI